jgi:hypothetical protein
MLSHHATLFISTQPDVVLKTLEQLHPTDEWVVHREATLSIGEVRRIISYAYGAPAYGEYRIIALIVERFGAEAQQALLKVLEEPPLSTRFVIIMPSVAGLLPTVLSRVALVHDATEEAVVPSEFSVYERASVPERMALIATAAKDKNGETYALWYQGLTTRLGLTASTLPPATKGRLLWCLTELGARGSAKKMLWEEVALTLPVQK